MIGAFVIDKPKGITSHDVVNRVRRVVATRRVGHAGTLDPFATGVLVVCVNQATRLIQFLMGLDKEYVATVRLGFATDTQDLTGKQITPVQSSDNVSLEDVRNAVREFQGPQLQMPPMYSAKKVSGQPLYKAAREGREVERQAVPVTIYSAEVAGDDFLTPPGADGTRDFCLRVLCSSGTYVRTLAHDLGQRLGVGAHLSELRRVAVGHLDLSTSIELDELEREGQRGELGDVLIPPSAVLAHLPAVSLNKRVEDLVRNGRAIEAEHEGIEGRQGAFTMRLLNEAGHLIAVGQHDPDSGLIRPRVVIGEV